MMSEYANTLISFVAQIQVFHWQTTSYAQHEAFGGLYSGIQGLADAFMETYMGKYGRSGEDSRGAFLVSYNVAEAGSKLDEFEEFLVSCDLPDSDLLNIRDEMLALVHKTKYLLTLN